ncbi:hypothetical protein EDD85DRAFT_337750 [Armillaria nabsnona]|nr:hypothetical protein EDD85DRAFT_337750 [Armillaria nabsnona]
MNVPMTLVLLGASFARMKIPHSFTKMLLPALFLGIVLQTHVAPYYWYTSHARADPPRYCTQGSSCRAFCCYAFERNTVSYKSTDRHTDICKGSRPRHTIRSLVATICLHVHFYCSYNAVAFLLL